MRFFTKIEDQYLLDNYLTIPACTMSRVLNRSKSSAMQRLRLLGLVVPKETIELFKKQSQFKNGQISYNKGLKQSDYMSAEAIERVKKHQFKVGRTPVNTKHDGMITIRADKNKKLYQFIRINQAEWIPLHRHIWVKENGPIKNGLKLIFKDGNTLNCQLDNLELVTPAELMRRNSLHNYPKQIIQMIKLTSKINKEISNRLKTINNEK